VIIDAYTIRIPVPEAFFLHKLIVAPRRLTVSDIRNKMVSVRRNELLAELFQHSHRIEKWGRGIKMILEREPRTEFEEVGTVLFVARFWRKELEKNISETAGVPSEETSEETSDKILAIIRSDTKTTARHIAGVLGLSSRAVEMQLAKLKQNGRLKRVGA